MPGKSTVRRMKGKVREAMQKSGRARKLPTYLQPEKKLGRQLMEAPKKEGDKAKRVMYQVVRLPSGRLVGAHTKEGRAELADRAAFRRLNSAR